MGVLCRAQVGAEASTSLWSVGNEDNTCINISDKNDIAKFTKHFRNLGLFHPSNIPSRGTFSGGELGLQKSGGKTKLTQLISSGTETGKKTKLCC